MDKERKGKEKRERKKREGRAKKEREEESDRERNEKGGFSRYSDCPRVKVDPRIAGYTCVPISWSFVKLREVENFPTWNIFSLISM